ncbi:hypothetical protein PDESU_03626 [Pontiella desulfatans]|uniref:Uncharacterized protein n=1 Tax=Pontiella desulfatans TaxID=2750659 RepID=A0A6C2U6N2_PONDE|nr:hypothetical protein [Pontiella desulfatans]VGO15046.1 hypothetical protein PDESU_03626 [Pontiella desulfatans]
MNQQAIMNPTIHQQINHHHQQMHLPPVFEQRQFMQPTIREQIQMAPPLRYGSRMY